MKYNKYFVYKKQTSEDGGQTWHDAEPLESKTSGDPIGTFDSLEECESGTPKFYATYSDDTNYYIGCTSTGDTLTSADTRGHSSAYSSMTEAVIGNCVTTLESDSLSGCQASSITMPNSLTTIGSSACSWCTNVVSLTIPNSITNIGNYAFNNCTSLANVTIDKATPPTLGTGAFNNTTCVIYVPSSAVNTYKNASGWSNYANRIQGF